MALDVPKRVQDYVVQREFVTVEDLMDRFGFKRATAYNYLSRLKGQGIISRVGYGRYRVGRLKQVLPPVTPKLKRIVDAIVEKMPFTEFTIWSTESLAEFSHYAIGKDVVFIEAKKGTSKKIRDLLLERDIRSIMEPSKKEMKEIFDILEEPLVIFQRKEGYATLKRNKVGIPLLERMIVDLYFYITRLGFPYPPAEYGRMLCNILRTRALNIDMLRKYASRRSVKEDMSALLSRLKERYPELLIPDMERRDSKIERMLEEMVEGAVP